MLVGCDRHFGSAADCLPGFLFDDCAGFWGVLLRGVLGVLSLWFGCMLVGCDRHFGSAADCLPGLFLDDCAGLWDALLRGIPGLLLGRGFPGLRCRAGFGLLTLGINPGLAFLVLGVKQRLELCGFAAGLRELVLQGFDPVEKTRHRLVPGCGGAVLQAGHVDFLLVDLLLKLDDLAVGFLRPGDVLFGLLGLRLGLGGAVLGFAGDLAGLGSPALGLREALVRLGDALTGFFGLRLCLGETLLGLGDALTSFLGLRLGLVGALVRFLKFRLGLTDPSFGLVGPRLRLQQPRVQGRLGSWSRGVVDDPRDHMRLDGGLVRDGLVVQIVGPLGVVLCVLCPGRHGG